MSGVLNLLDYHASESFSFASQIRIELQARKVEDNICLNLYNNVTGLQIEIRKLQTQKHDYQAVSNITGQLSIINSTIELCHKKYITK